MGTEASLGHSIVFQFGKLVSGRAHTDQLVS